MDLITYALAKKHASQAVSQAKEELKNSITEAISDISSSKIPYMGKDGYWWIGNTSTGIRVKHNVEVDGTLVSDNANGQIYVEKDGEKVIVLEGHDRIPNDEINELFV